MGVSRSVTVELHRRKDGANSRLSENGNRPTAMLVEGCVIVERHWTLKSQREATCQTRRQLRRLALASNPPPSHSNLVLNLARVFADTGWRAFVSVPLRRPRPFAIVSCFTRTAIV